MKKLVIIALAFFALQATAQERKRGQHGKERAQKMMNLSAEEAATLQTKKMTLFLDLNESQQAKIYKVNLESEFDLIRPNVCIKVLSRDNCCPSSNSCGNC